MTRALPLYQVDAFTAERFRGNPAAVMPLTEALPDALMQSIAAENNLSETAFLQRRPGASVEYDIRWFTPALEVQLCGHATLASAAVVFEKLEPQATRVTFHSLSGPLYVERVTLPTGAAGYALDFPRDVPDVVEDAALIAQVSDAFGGLEVLGLLCSHVADFGGVRPAVAHHGELAFIDPGRAEFPGLIDPDHAVEVFAVHHRLLAGSFCRIAEEPKTGSHFSARCLAPYFRYAASATTAAPPSTEKRKLKPARLTPHSVHCGMSQATM